MGKDREELTPEAFGEMFVRWRLDDGLLDSGDDEYIRVIGIDALERTITVNDFAREKSI